MDAKGLISSSCKRVDIVSSKELRWCFTKPISWNDNMFYCLKLQLKLHGSHPERKHYLTSILYMYYKIYSIPSSNPRISDALSLCKARPLINQTKQHHEQLTAFTKKLIISATRSFTSSIVLGAAAPALERGENKIYMWTQPPPTVDVSGQIIRLFLTN